MPRMTSFDSIWKDATDDGTNIAWTRAGWDAMSPWATGDRIYLNCPGHGEDGALTELPFAAANHRRLREIKRRCDPTNVFRFNANIEPLGDGDGNGDADPA